MSENYNPLCKNAKTMEEFVVLYEKIMGEPVVWDKPNENLPEGMIKTDVTFFQKKG